MQKSLLWEGLQPRNCGIGKSRPYNRNKPDIPDCGRGFSPEAVVSENPDHTAATILTYPMRSIEDYACMKTGYRKLRAGRWSSEGQIYFITFNTLERRKLFCDCAVAADSARSIQETAQRLDGRLIAWVLMPDHWHGLIEIGNWMSLPTYVGRLKGAVSRKLKLLHPNLPAVWQDGFHDHAIRRCESIETIADYLLMNPIRAGLAENLSQYPYWYCEWPVPNISIAAIDPLTDPNRRG